MVPLKEQLSRGPAYLFLGQRWLVDANGNDPLLSQTLKKFPPAMPVVGTSGYSALLTTDAASEGAALEWMAGRCPNIVPPERMTTVAKFPWSGVFSSAIDDVLAELFRNPTRDVQRVMSTDYQPADPRSRSKLHIWYPYGNVAAPDEAGKPPLTRLGLIRRRNTATQMVAQLSEFVTSLGTLIIEGYDPDTDWHNAELFYAMVSDFEPGQVHWFGTHQTVQDNPLIKPLLNSGQLTLYADSLAQALLAGNVDDLLSDSGEDEDIWSRRLRVGKRVVSVPTDLFRQVQVTGRLITEVAFAPLRKLSAQENYSEFRTFLYESSHRPSWEAFARGFAFRREFQSLLQDTVKAQLSRPSERGRGEPVMLHGATGSGKTVALGQLAFETQRRGETPVLFIDRSTRVHSETIDRFCRWAEETGAAAVVVIWDGMTSPREYYNLHSFLQSRGRKFVLVSSTYQTDANFLRLRNSVRADSKMSATERKDFFEFLKAANFSEVISYLKDTDDESFLGQLYRALPTTRFPLQAGLGREVDHASELIQRQKLIGSASGPNGKFGTSLNDLFADLKIGPPPKTLGEVREVIAGEDIDEVRQLIGLIMVPGQFGIACPFELVMRGIGRGIDGRLLELLKSVDIFQLSEDNVGNPLVEARTALEANLIVRRTLGGPKGEIDYAIKLLLNMRASAVTGTRELDFAVDLLHNIGPHGPRQDYYRPHFARLAACLRELRTERGVRHVRLFLQESGFLREAAKNSGGLGSDEIVLPEKREHLQQALDVCDQALKQLDDHRSTRSLKSQLYVEKASTWGTLAKSEEDVTERLRMVMEAHGAAWQAFSLDSSNYYVFDVVAWTGRDILRDGSLAPEERLRVIESVAHIFAMTEGEDWGAEAAIQLDRRRFELRDLVFRSEVGQQAFENLLRRGSAAGVVIKAWQLAEGDEKQHSENKARAAQALAWMDEPRHRSVVSTDANATFLRFKLWWRSHLGHDFSATERMALPFTSELWGECLDFVRTLLNWERFREHPTLRLIEAVALFHHGESGVGFTAFEAMNKELLFPRNRVIRRFIFSDAHGRPRHFSGSVARLEGRNGELQVPSFSRRIPFFTDEANRVDLRRGDDLHGFGIAFNMLGPIAEFRLDDPRL